MARLVALVTILSLALAAPAFGGGWAVTTLDAVPDRFKGGHAYDIGYTIRQHGVTPVDLARTGIRITSDDPVRSITFDGRKDGPVGHYVVQVTFPAAGAWRWEALQDWFGPQPLGAVQVVASSGAPAAGVPAADVRTVPAPGETAPNALLIAALLMALAGAAVLVGGGIASATTRVRA